LTYKKKEFKKITSYIITMAPPTKYTLTIFSDDEHKKVLFKKEYTNKKDLCEHFNLNAYAVQNFFKSKPQKVSLKKQKELKRVEIRMETKKKKSDPPIIKVYNSEGNGKTIIIENEWVPPIDTCWVCSDKFPCEGYVMGYPICDDCYPAWKAGVECSLKNIEKEKQAKQIEEEEKKDIKDNEIVILTEKDDESKKD